MNRPTAEALSKKIHDAVITAILEFFGPVDQVPAQPENGKSAAAAILAPPPPPTVPIFSDVDRWATKKPLEYETIEVCPLKIEKKGTRLSVSWAIAGPNGRGFLYASVWDPGLFPFVESRLQQKTTLYITRKDKFINIVGVRA